MFKDGGAAKTFEIDILKDALYIPEETLQDPEPEFNSATELPAPNDATKTEGEKVTNLASIGRTVTPAQHEDTELHKMANDEEMEEAPKFTKDEPPAPRFQEAALLDRSSDSIYEQDPEGSVQEQQTIVHTPHVQDPAEVLQP